MAIAAACEKESKKPLVARLEAYLSELQGRRTFCCLTGGSRADPTPGASPRPVLLRPQRQGPGQSLSALLELVEPVRVAAWPAAWHAAPGWRLPRLPAGR